MSLTTLTFSSSNEYSSGFSRGKIRVLKADQFFGVNEVCVIGKLVDGAVAKEMFVPGTKKRIISVESNYGEGSCTKKGAQVVLMVENASKDDYSTGQEIEFERIALAQEIAKPKGKLIIA